MTDEQEQMCAQDADAEKPDALKLLALIKGIDTAQLWDCFDRERLRQLAVLAGVRPEIARYMFGGGMDDGADAE